MKTLSSDVTTAAAALQQGWCEVYDIYLRSSISTPWGTTSTLRLTTNPAGLSFFTPLIAPEPAGTRGDAATYYHWPLKRERVHTETKFTNDQMRITGSNASAEWQAMLAAVSWYDTPICIRLVPLISGAANDDCAVLWVGQVDAATINDRQIGLVCSNDMASIARELPQENMHTRCRFKWGDDQCTALKWKSTNYKAGTCGADSTATLVKSSDFTEDTGSSASYGTDLVATATITASSELAGYVNEAVTAVPVLSYFTISSDLILNTGAAVTFAADVMPTGLSAATTYYLRKYGSKMFWVCATLSDALNNMHLIPVVFTSAGTNVTMSSDNFTAEQVVDGQPGWWKFSTDADWGTLADSFRLIPDAQAGLANAALKPWIKFNFGSAKTPKCWRVSTVSGVGPEDLARLLVFFSSTNDSDWVFESYFECPPTGGVLYDVLIPNAASARYWRIAVRTRWSDTLAYSLLNKVYAYETSRNFWAGGRIKFDSDTSTVALRNVSRRVIGSYSGEVSVLTLPAAPANGDTFKIERGCRRTFNDCAARLNTENFGGFLDLPYQAVIR